MSWVNLLEVLGGGVLGFAYGLILRKTINNHYISCDEPFQNWKGVMPAAVIAGGLAFLVHPIAVIGFIVGNIGSMYINRKPKKRRRNSYIER
jgi:hypothetical protein